MHDRPAYAEIVGFHIPDDRYRIGQVIDKTFILIDDNGDFHSVELRLGRGLAARPDKNLVAAV